MYIMYLLEVGSQIMIVGSTGVGKSTIAQTLILHKKTYVSRGRTKICYLLLQYMAEHL